MVPQDVDADIDDVLKQSEALLDRLQANQSERDLDGAASMSSMTSLGSIMNSSVKELTTPKNIMSPKRTIRVKIPTSTPVQTGLPPLVSPLATPKPPVAPVKYSAEVPHDVPDLETAPTMQTVNKSSREYAQKQQPPPPPPPSHGRAPNWEKVSSAAQGDDDYVPMADYTKFKPTASHAPQKLISSKVTRLEAYRKKAQQRRRRRRLVGLIVSFFLVIAYRMYSLRSRRSTVTKNVPSIERLESNVVEAETESLPPTVQEVIEKEAESPPEEDASAEVETVPDISFEEQKHHDDGLLSPLATKRRELPVDFCEHPVIKLVSKSCRNAAKASRVKLHSLMEEPVQAMVKNPVFWVV